VTRNWFVDIPEKKVVALKRDQLADVYPLMHIYLRFSSQNVEFSIGP
jgi:hypothetical protein